MSEVPLHSQSGLTRDVPSISDHLSVTLTAAGGATVLSSTPVSIGRDALVAVTVHTCG